MNSRALIIIGIVCLVLIATGGAYLLLRNSSSTLPSPSDGTVFPGSGTTGGGTGGTSSASVRPIQTQDHTQISVKDFTKEPGVTADPNAPGQYDLAGGASPTASTPYQIFYQTTDDYFGITLYHEPLGRNRQAAEQELMNKLGLTTAEMCSLNYVVAPGPGVSDIYAGQNLGFSFCPGAVPLP